MELAQVLLDILLDSLGEEVVRCGDGVGRVEDLVPGGLEDAAKGRIVRHTLVGDARNAAAVAMQGEGGHSPQVGRGVGHLEQQQLLEPSNILILEPPAFL